MEIPEEDRLAYAVRSLLNLPIWKDIESYMEFQREAIIQKGKKSRSNSVDVKMWAELDGFDKCRSIFYRLADYNKIEESIPKSSTGSIKIEGEE